MKQLLKNTFVKPFSYLKYRFSKAKIDVLSSLEKDSILLENDDNKNNQSKNLQTQ